MSLLSLYWSNEYQHWFHKKILTPQFWTSAFFPIYNIYISFYIAFKNQCHFAIIRWPFTRHSILCLFCVLVSKNRTDMRIHWGRVSTYSEMCCRVPKTGWIHFVHASLWYQIPEAAISGVRQEISDFKVADNYSTMSSNRKAYKRFGTFCIGNSSVTSFQNKTQTALLNSRQTPVTLAHLSAFWMTQPLSNKDCHDTKGPAIDVVQSVSFSQQGCVLMTSLSAFPGVTSRW